MKKGVIVFSRLTSARFPKKALARIAGRSLIEWTISATLRTIADEVVVATSEESSDDELAEAVEKLGVEIYRGSLDDVLGRALSCAEEFQFDAFARVNGDSPLTDPYLIDKGFHILEKQGLDFVTNLVPRTYPYGVSCEIIRTETLRRMEADLVNLYHREHLTSGIYESMGALRVGRITSEEDWSSLHLTVDEKRDAQILESVLLASEDDVAPDYRRIAAMLGGY